MPPGSPLAIGEADAGSGVVVLADLGSAVLATRTALELLGNPENVRLSRGPIVEGADHRSRPGEHRLEPGRGPGGGRGGSFPAQGIEWTGLPSESAGTGEQTHARGTLTRGHAAR